MPEVLLLIPPLTQLNTPYPATAYLTGFLRREGIDCSQGDLGLDLVLGLFQKNGLKKLFDEIENGNFRLPHSLENVFLNRGRYEDTIDDVISFLQNKRYTLAYRIATRQYLPEGGRFQHLKDMKDLYGSNGVQDKARYLCTLYLEDLSDLIQSTIGPHFGFSKYAERVARTAVSFAPIKEALEAPDNYLDKQLLEATARYFEAEPPLLVGFTVPFPGNLYGALKAGQWIKRHYPSTRIVLGGGYANTELRELYDPATFDYVDFITLDDGERPLLALYNHLKNPSAHPFIKRTFLRENGKVKLVNSLKESDIPQSQLPAPTYDGLKVNDYLSMFDMPNPMHRLWNDGRWNKLTIAHGCYWKKCSFCDISLDYIGRFEQTKAKLLVDKMEELIATTGETGFHFVDEAAPPLAMRDLAMEIISRNLQVSWWTNIRFEKTFTPGLCRLLAASGCVAVTGGLEVASPRLLELMEKGITIEQVARVCKGFRDAGILVHAYLMYGFPTETEQETIDSLEVVRQLFENGLLQSAFWHQFAMTVHSPVGLNPEKYKVLRTGPELRGFANNDLYHDDPTGADHQKFSDGLTKALYNYMHGNAMNFPLQNFFSFPIPDTIIPRSLVAKFFKRPVMDDAEIIGYRLMWHGINVKLQQKGRLAEVHFIGKKGIIKIEMPFPVANYIREHTGRFEPAAGIPLDFREVVRTFSELLHLDRQEIVSSQWWRKWREEVVWVIKG
ncbi:MAG: radical SAM protein [Crocinitomicaceae bacterium]|nr:radical SAM protein [Crocinitomicaceae bacterium]